MTQYDKLKSHLRHQTDLILNKLNKLKPTKEINNYHTELLAYESCNHDIKDPVFIERMEAIREALTSLTFDEMKVYSLRYADGMTNAEIGLHFGHKEAWARKEVDKLINKLTKRLNELGGHCKPPKSTF